jgi:HEPN domain-containing protein
MSESRETLAQWVQRAENDFKAAEILFHADPLILDIACFHYQQSVEKFLKAFLVLHDKEFLLSHNIEYLLDLCAGIDFAFSDLDPKRLSIYAVRARYPHEHFAPERDEVAYYQAFTLSVKALVLPKINNVLS